jgi:hypothetical protein
MQYIISIIQEDIGNIGSTEQRQISETTQCIKHNEPNKHSVVKMITMPAKLQLVTDKCNLHISSHHDTWSVSFIPADFWTQVHLKVLFKIPYV